VTGPRGFLAGHCIERLRRIPGATVLSAGRDPRADFPADLARPGALAAALRVARPTHVVHAAALATVAACERDPALATRVNVAATAEAARATAEIGARLLVFSTDQVFDGESAPYAEDAVPRPLHRYGATKALAEDAARAAPDHVVLRVALVLGRSRAGDRTPSETVIAAARRGAAAPLFVDEWRSPVAVAYLAEVVAALLGSSFRGTLHVGGPERLTRFTLGERICAALGLDAARALRPARRSEAPGPPRPRDLALDSTRLGTTLDVVHEPLCTAIAGERPWPESPCTPRDERPPG